MNKVKKQHFVPQESLRRFASRPGRIFVFDKQERRVFDAPIDRTACQEYFYDLKTIDHDPDVPENFQVAEKGFTEIEEIGQPIIAAVLRQLEPFISGRKPEKFSRERFLYKKEKQKLGLFILAQYMRTPAQKEVIVNTARRFLAVQASIALSNAGIDPENTPINVEVSREAATGSHVSMAFKVALAAGPALVNHIWLLTAVPPEVPLISSDSPVILAPDEGTAPVEGGILSPQIQILINLSPRVNLSLVQRTRFPELTKSDGRCHRSSPEVVDYLNALHLKASARYLYSNTSDFAWAEKLLEQNPTWREPGQGKVELSGPYADALDPVLDSTSDSYTLYWGRHETPDSKMGQKR